MQKFGLDSQRSRKLTAFEIEIFKEQATSLGRAGKKLRLSIQRLVDAPSAHHIDRQGLIDAIASNVWELSMQRELVGLVHDNLQWIVENYAVPTEALSKLGLAQHK